MQGCPCISSRRATTIGHRPLGLRMILVPDSPAVAVQAVLAVRFTVAVPVVRGEEANSVFDNISRRFAGASG